MWRNKLNLILEGTGWKRRGMMIGERVETENLSDVLRLGAENGARTRDLNLLARPPQTAFISVDDGSYATDPREKEANEFA